MKPASLPRLAVSNVLVPAAIAVGLFLALEGGCRLAGRIRSGSWPETRAEAYTKFVRKIGTAYQLHPVLVVTGRPDAVLRAAGKEVVFNARGQRGTNLLNLPVPKPAGRFRIVCEGGSTTFDLLAENNAATWAARLGRALEARNVDVANAGFPGWTSLESLLSLEIRDVELGPDLVLVYSGVNDLQPAGHEPFASDYSAGHLEILPRVTGAAPVPVRLVARSLLLESLLDRLRPGRPEGVEGFAPAYAWTGGPKKDDIPAAAVAVYERNLLSTIGVATARGAKVMLVPQVLRVRRGHEARDTEWIEGWCPGLTVAGSRRGLERYNDVMRKLAREGRALLFEPFETAVPPDEDLADPCHFSPEGSERFARRLADVVSKTFLEGRSR
ncbi:MAG TPA: SGNH/GDSL hydrolase family protein [Thermoanaerobaculia bacterium]|nr:SGNH/GDSL hydrolase family protein [Thermoanaerobaculia bacterium]